MKVIRSLNQVRKYKNPVVALGVFDGVHLGHRKILLACVAMAKGIKGTSVVLTFWPHPQKEESVYSLEHRLRLIAGLGVDICVLINFNKKFATITADSFIKKILVNKLGACHIYIGKNFRFGRNQQGTLNTLRKFSGIYNFEVKAFPVVKINNRIISSTAIRSLIKKGNLYAAGKMLARPVSILGTVIKGESQATKLGFPTANIDPHHEVIPACGIYAVKVLVEGRKFNGVCYIGRKPTFRQYGPRSIEVHIFGFKNKLYGKYLEIQFMKKIREEAKFTSQTVLVKAIKKDLILARSYFSRHK